jgi:hypothetical protein
MAKRTVQRQSQLITTFGPGAMVDLPTRSVLIGGLDRWYAPKGSYTPIEEPALARYLENWLRDRDRLQEGRALRLLTPPLAAAEWKGEPPGVDVTVFPTWFICERVETPTIGGQPRRGRRLVRWSELEAVGGRRRFLHDDGKKLEVSPLRFVGACERGHLQDVDWRRLVHAGEPCQEPMWLMEEGTSASLGDLEIMCSCGRSLSLRDATKPGRLGKCDGRQPWLSADAREPCSENLRLLTRSATNAYFPQVVNVISLPVEEDALIVIIKRHLADLSSAESSDDIRAARRFNSALRMDLDGYSDQEVYERLQRVKEQIGQDASTNPRVLEFDVLASGRRQIGLNEAGARLYGETLPREEWAEDVGRGLGVIRGVVAVHRLREVMCLYGFTRLEPAPTTADADLEDIQLAVSGAPIAQHADWLPAIEQFGEGIFVHFDPARIENWISRPGVSQRLDVLHRGLVAHKRKYPASAEQRFPGGPYVLLHSLAHALMTEIALDCGYPASSLKERIYAFPSSDTAAARYGLLIYTASTGSQGTLGGLVAGAKRFSRILDAALERLEICSNDPVCADHDPGSAVENRHLLGAACHGCLLIAETSCERRNQFLDRSLLVRTMADTGSNLF